MDPLSDHKTIQQIKRHRAAKLARILAGAYYRWRKKQFEDTYRFICEEFISLGGVYVKFLQGMLLRSEFMQNWQSAERFRIFENLETEPIDIHELLKRELPSEKLKDITALNPVPFAAGSFGQVYYGQHADGTQIIIKALRPLVRETLRFDLRLISIFMRRFNRRLYPNLDVDLKRPLEDFKNATLRETDYAGEAAFADEMYQHYKDHKQFVIPKTYLDLSTKNIITQEYIDGISAAHLVKLREQGVEPADYVKHYLGSNLEDQLETLGYEYVLGIFTLERIQGDPHPGNVRFMKDDKVGLIDFGIYARTPKDKPALFGLMKQYMNIYHGETDIAALFGEFIRFFSPELYLALDRINQLLPKDQQTESLAHDIGVVAAESFSKKASEADMRQMVKDGTIIKTINELANKDNRFGLIMRVESADMLRAAQTYLTLAESLTGPDVLKRVFSRAIGTIADKMPELTRVGDNPVSVNRAVEIIAGWLERVAERDPQLFSVLSAKMRSSEKEAKEIEKTITKEIS